MNTSKDPKSRPGTAIYLSHGGGPLPVLGDPGHTAMVDFMEQLPGRLPRPEAILVISAHWEESQPTLLGSPQPSMLFDYSGFPEESYNLSYPAPGHPDLAEHLAGLLEKGGLPCNTDTQRGFDHGLYIPLLMMYPEAEIPALQLSLVRGLDADLHLRLGQALGSLLDQNILVLGSGFSFHNMRRFVWDASYPHDPDNDAFQDWLVETCTGDLEAATRRDRLVRWEQGPAARYCHPREEHLLPLQVCAGMAGVEVAAEKIFDAPIMGKRAVAFRW